MNMVIMKMADSSIYNQSKVSNSYCVGCSSFSGFTDLGWRVYNLASMSPNGSVLIDILRAYV